MTDSPIRFPGLFGDWAFTASSKAIDIGHGIYWYGIIIAFGLLLAVAFCLHQRKRYGITEDDLMDCILWGIPCGIISRRMHFSRCYVYRLLDQACDRLCQMEEARLGLKKNEK